MHLTVKGSSTEEVSQPFNTNSDPLDLGKQICDQSSVAIYDTFSSVTFKLDMIKSRTPD